jgi:hypothetical protein
MQVPAKTDDPRNQPEETNGIEEHRLRFVCDQQRDPQCNEHHSANGYKPDVQRLKFGLISGIVTQIRSL